MAEVVNRRLNVYIDSAGAEEALTRLTKKEADLVKQIDKAKAAGKDFTAEMKKLGDTRQQISQLEGVISGKMLPSVRQAEAAVSNLRREIRKLPADSEAAARKLQEFKKAEATLRLVKEQAFGASQALDSLKKDRGLKGVFENAFGFFLGGGLLGAVSALTTGVTQFFSQSIEGALEAEKATARLKSVLDNLGRQDVFGRLSAQADQLAESFGFLDNDDIIGVFEQLITYGKLTEDQINQLTPVIIDFAAKSQVELSEAASVVIKALEGNGKALKEYGIEVTGAKDETEAFGIIMDQLKPKVDGAAKAFGDTTAGQIAKTRQEIQNLKEDIGTDLLPVVKSFYKFISDALAGTKSLIETIQVAGDTTKFSVMDRVKLFFGDPVVAARVEIEKARRIAKQGSGGTTAPSSGGGVIGLGSTESPEERKKREAEARKAAEARKKEFDDLKAKYKDFAQTIRKERVDVTFGEIFAAFRKINEEAEKDLAKLGEFQKKGLVTPAEFEELTTAVEAILEAQRVKLQEKFGLNPIRIPVQLVPPDMDRDANADAKTFGEKVFADLKKGLEGLNDPTFFEENAQLIQQWGDQVAGVFLNVFSLRSQAEQNAFNQEVANNEKRKENYRKLLESNAITQKEYDRRVAKIEAEQEKRRIELSKRQFQRDKAAQITQAVMSAAQAVISTLAARPGSLDILSLGAFRAISLGLIAASTGAQIAVIAKQKPPQFEDGGFIPQGSSHKQGGISLIDNRTGANLGEVEGGEPIISKKVYAQNRAMIDSLLNPGWKNQQVSAINIPRINRSMQQRYFADGGILPNPSGASGMEDLVRAVNALNQRLNEPIISYTVYGDYELKANKINAIRNSGVIR